MSPDAIRSRRSIAGAPWLDWPETRAIFTALSKGGVEARAVGGAVRNTLLGCAVTEVDIATPAPPERVMALVSDAGLKAVPTGIEHGTVTVIAGHRPFEVTTLRKDVETYGRRAKVAFTDDWAADAERRDFTINAIYAGPDGTLSDPMGGLDDIETRTIRFIGDARARIREDYLRILRFFRFNAEYGRPPYDAYGLAACVAERAGLALLSPERVSKELLRLLAAPGAASAVAAMFEYGLLVDVLAAVPYLRRFERVVALEGALGLASDAVLRLAALTVAVEEDADRLRDRLRLANADHARLLRAAKCARLRRLPSEREARADLYRTGAQWWRDRVLLAWAQSSAPPDDAGWSALLRLPERWPVPSFPLRGRDLLAAGLADGPRIGALLKRLEAEWIADDFADDRDALLQKARTLIAETREG